MPKITVNGEEVEFEQGMTLLQACEVAGEEIPRFCYHERLKIAGNCRMCLVEVEGGPPKPAASCALPAADGMVVHTNSPMVKKAREGVMEFLLINHPLDCPICDQGGECDLQDQAMFYGRGGSRYDENKRAVKEKYMGPLIKTHMTRCIHCTRCVRFLDDVAGIEELGAVNRGEDMEISTYVGKSLSSELSGNIVDLCPVGALTSRPYTFKARPWELRKTQTIDVLDAVGSAIRVDARGREVMRILPRLNEEVNEEWISDKTRHACDGLKVQRLDRPYARNKEGKLEPVTWHEAYDAVAVKVKKAKSASKVAGLIGDLADCEAMTAMKLLFEAMGSPHLDCRLDGMDVDVLNRSSYLFNTTIEGIEEADACLIIGSNPRHEAAILNARIRKTQMNKNMPIAYIGQAMETTYPADHLGEDALVLEAIAKGSHPFADTLKQAKKPMLILGSNALSRPDAKAVQALACEIAQTYGLVHEGWNGYNVLHRSASRVGGLDLGCVPAEDGLAAQAIMKAASKKELDVVFLYGADEIDVSRLKDVFVVYIGHHGDKGAHIADVILPAAAYTEKNATYVNTEGRVQQTRLAVYPPRDAKEDWVIFQELSIALGHNIGFTSIKVLRKKMQELAPHFALMDKIEPAEWHTCGQKGEVVKTPFTNPVKNFYMTDPISRSSKTMAECSKAMLAEKDNKAMKKKDAA